MKQQGLWQRLDHAARGLIPLATALILMLLGLIPWHVPDLGTVAPPLAMMAVFYWSIHRPDLMTAPKAFTIGLFQDLLTGPLGVNALVMLLVQGGCASQQKFFHGKTFMVSWWGFALVALPSVLLSWALASALLGAMVPIWPTTILYGLTVGLFPPAAWMLIKTQARFLRGV